MYKGSCHCGTGEHMAVNFRMSDREVIDQFEVKRFDGADTWKFLEDD